MPGLPCSEEPSDDDEMEQRGLEDEDSVEEAGPATPRTARWWKPVPVPVEEVPDARPLSRLAVLCRDPDPDPDPDPDDPGLSLPGLCNRRDDRTK